VIPRPYLTARYYARIVRNTLLSARGSRYVHAGHFYSPIPSENDWRRALASADHPGPDIDLHEGDQLALAAELTAHAGGVEAGPRYQVGNSQYPWADASVYRAMLTHLRPARVVEVGSGHSSGLALDTCDVEGLETTFTFVDPYPERLMSVLTETDRQRVRIRDVPVQDVEYAVFDQLESGDFLFIDSTHVAKAGSDVNHLYFKVLPRLTSDVWIHVHDIFWPFEYPREWLAEGRAWNEIYLLRAFLSSNAVFRVRFFSDYLAQRHPDVFAPFVSASIPDTPGSIWLTKD
jgi:hypothetical protein